MPWQGQTARQTAGRRVDAENATLRIPPRVLGPYLRRALFYVSTASADILAAGEELGRLAARPAGSGGGLDRLAGFVGQAGQRAVACRPPRRGRAGPATLASTSP